MFPSYIVISISLAILEGLFFLGVGLFVNPGIILYTCRPAGALSDNLGYYNASRDLEIAPTGLVVYVHIGLTHNSMSYDNFYQNMPKREQNMNQIPNRGYCQLRRGRKSISGTYYSITLATHNRTSVLTMRGIPDVIFECFDWLETDNRLKWICVMVMPDHVHAVFQLGNKQTLPRLIQSFKRFTANQINAFLVRTGPIWQVNYYDHGIRSDESLEEIIRYCYENPVRKGLVRRPEDYPHWRCKFDMQ